MGKRNSGQKGNLFRRAMIQLKRVYEPPAASDGTRLLVERLWPRGLKKEKLKLDGWLREAAPSTALRKWFNHDPARWPEFQRRYRGELDRQPEAWRPILKATGRGTVTLLFSSRNAEYNNVVALKAYLELQIKKSRQAG
jgi:uncharacterized protein YeaO (DUF488 family)